ncbi:MAG: hypothetical protein AAGU03_01810 [Anaerolineaceae bacterium]
MKNCPMCGYQNDDTSITCVRCDTNLGYRNQVLYETIRRVDNIDKNLGAIKGWVTFLGILALIGLIFDFISGFIAGFLSVL